MTARAIRRSCWRTAALAAGMLLAGAGAAAAQAAPGAGDPLSGLLGPDGLVTQAAGGVGRNAVLLFVAMTVLSLAPAIAIMVTCFPFVVTVMSILRQSIGLPQTPPNMLIVALSLVLTWYVMDPVLQAAWRDAGRPLQAGEITLSEAFARGSVPFRGFMAGRVDPDTYAALADVAPARLAGPEAAPAAPAPHAAPPLPAAEPSAAAPAGTSGAQVDPAAAQGLRPGPGEDGFAQQAPLAVLVPAFMLSEIQRAFEVGFLIALPFLIIDLVVSAVLMSMGMMMVPPAVVSLPFKLAFFAVVNGWSLVAAALVRGYQ